MGNTQINSGLPDIELNPIPEGKAYPPVARPASIWGIAALFYFAGFYIKRVSPRGDDRRVDACVWNWRGEPSGIPRPSICISMWRCRSRQGTWLIPGARKLLIAGSIAAVRWSCPVRLNEQFCRRLRRQSNHWRGHCCWLAGYAQAGDTLVSSATICNALRAWVVHRQHRRPYSTRSTPVGNPASQLASDCFCLRRCGASRRVAGYAVCQERPQG